MAEPWQQNFSPLGNELLSTVAAVTPVCVLFYFHAVRRVAAWKAAGYAFVAAVALAVFYMPPGMGGGAIGGLCNGWFRIRWVLAAFVFVYKVSVESGQFAVAKESIASLSTVRRIQGVLIAFAFGALLEGFGGAGAPMAITGSMMVGLGFPHLETTAIRLLANSAAVAFGGLGNPVRTLVAVARLAEADFSAMIGRILPITTLLLPFWLVRLMYPALQAPAVWPALLACALIFGSIQSNYGGGALVCVSKVWVRCWPLNRWSSHARRLARRVKRGPFRGGPQASTVWLYSHSWVGSLCYRPTYFRVRFRIDTKIDTN